MKNVLFIRTHNTAIHRAVVHPLGSLSLAARLREAFPGEYRIKILHTGTVDQPLNVVSSTIREFAPEFVVLTVLTPEIRFMNSLVSMVKSQDSRTRIFAGGPYPSSMPEHALQQEGIDAVGIGEGEETILELIRSEDTSTPYNAIDGIAFRENGRVVKTNPRTPVGNLDRLPMPAWDLIDLEPYKYLINMSNTLRGHNYAGLYTSRGCPYRCIYCHSIHGRIFRARSAEKVFEEMMFLFTNYGIDEFHILDDIFNLDRERMQAICRMMIESGERFHLSFPNGIRADLLEPEDIDLLEAAGTYKICFAIETRSPRLQKIINKNNRFEKIDKVIAYTAATSIITSSFFMLGFPTETREELEQTIRYAVNSDLDSGAFFQVIPYPGTELAGWAVRENAQLADSFNFKPELFHFSSGHSATTHLSHRELTYYVLSAYLRFYLKPRRLRGLARKLPEYRSFFRDLLIILHLYIRYSLKMERAPKTFQNPQVV